MSEFAGIMRNLSREINNQQIYKQNQISLSESLDSDPEFTAVDWTAYLPTKVVTVREAIALSVGINPKHRGCLLDSDMLKYATGNAHELLSKLINRCKLINDNDIPFKELGRDYLSNKISLCDFLKWAEEHAKWDITKEFPRACKPASKEQIHKLGATPIKQGEIIPMVEPRNKEDWFYAFRDCVRAFEQEHGYTPNETQLWIRLKTNPPTEYGIEWDEKRSRLLIGGDKPWDREAFHKTYERRYPSQKPATR